MVEHSFILLLTVWQKTHSQMKLNSSGLRRLFFIRVIIITISPCIEKNVWLLVNRALDVTSFLFVRGIIHVLKSFVRVLPKRRYNHLLGQLTNLFCF